MPKLGSDTEEGTREGSEKRSVWSQSGDGEIPKLFPEKDECAPAVRIQIICTRDTYHNPESIGFVNKPLV